MSKKGELAKAGQFQQEDIPKLLQQVKDQISKLKGGDGKEPSTVGKSLPSFGEIAHINSEQDLIKAFSSVTEKEVMYKGAIKEMGLSGKIPTFDLEGVSAKKWKDDIKLRYAEVSQKQKLATLTAIQKELEDNLSAKDKLNNSLGKIAEHMADLGA